MSRFESFLVYTTEEGGKLSVFWANYAAYEEAKRTGRLDIGLNEPEWVELKMVAFAPLGELCDFVASSRAVLA